MTIVDLSVRIATELDAPAIAQIRAAAGERLTREYGKGHWSSPVREPSVLRAIRTSRVFVAQDAEGGIIGTLQLATKKPWAIDLRYYVKSRRPLYLIDMAVDPSVQRRGVGRFMLEHAEAFARSFPADAIRLDAYDAPAGAGGFYERCGYHEVGRAPYRGVPLIYYELLL